MIGALVLFALVLCVKIGLVGFSFFGMGKPNRPSR